MARTVGHKVSSGSRASALCDYCGTRWPREKLRRDASGLLNCPQEGKGRDAVTLTKANVASAEAAARRTNRRGEKPGMLDKETAEPIP